MSQDGRSTGEAPETVAAIEGLSIGGGLQVSVRVACDDAAATESEHVTIVDFDGLRSIRVRVSSQTPPNSDLRYVESRNGDSRHVESWQDTRELLPPARPRWRWSTPPRREEYSATLVCPHIDRKDAQIHVKFETQDVAQDGDWHARATLPLTIPCPFVPPMGKR